MTSTFQPLKSINTLLLAGFMATAALAATAQALQQALGEKSLFSDTLRACVPGANELKFQLRSLLHYHCGVGVFKTRQMMIDLQAF